MTETVASLTIQDLPRFLPYVRKLAWKYGRGLSIDADDFAQDICLRAVQFPPRDCVNDNVYRVWLYIIARTVGAEQRQYDARPKRAGVTCSIDASEFLPPIGGGQYEHTLLCELLRNGRERLRTRQIRGQALDRRWRLLWSVAGGGYAASELRHRGCVLLARRALQEEFAL